MVTDNLHIGEEGRARLITGIKKCAEAVGITMGTGGSNSLIEAIEHPGHYTTNDGATILESIHLKDRIEDMGRKILLEAVKRANKMSGDGSSTTCVLTAAIIEEGLKHVGESSLMEIKRSLEECIPLIEKSINEQTREITVDEVGAVCAVSAEDEAIGALIQEIYQKIGKEGIIYWDISKTTEDSYTLGTGLTMDGAGFLSPYMADMDEKSGQFLNVARWKNAHVLITTQKITSAADFNDLFADLYKNDIKEVVVFCDEIEAIVVPDLLKTRAVRGFKTLVVKMPVLWKDQWYLDLAQATGATIINPSLGLALKDAKMSHLGTVGNITVTKEDTFLDGIRDMSEYAATLEDENRRARLNLKTARLFVGAHSESALAYKRLKVEDAIAAGWQALNGGIVAGGGVALRDVVLPSDTVGGQILQIALLAPMRQIVKNADAQMPEDEEQDCGLDTRTGEVVNMFDAKITDPANITLNAVKNAISVAASVISTRTIVTYETD